MSSPRVFYGWWITLVFSIMVFVSAGVRHAVCVDQRAARRGGAPRAPGEQPGAELVDAGAEHESDPAADPTLSGERRRGAERGGDAEQPHRDDDYGEEHLEQRKAAWRSAHGAKIGPGARAASSNSCEL